METKKNPKKWSLSAKASHRLMIILYIVGFIGIIWATMLLGQKTSRVIEMSKTYPTLLDSNSSTK